MKTEQERFAELTAMFKQAIVDRLEEIADKNVVNGKPTYVPSTETWLGAGFSAWKEIIESETDPIGPMLAVAVWEEVMKSNESAFRQHLKRLADAGQLKFAVMASARSPISRAADYLSK